MAERLLAQGASSSIQVADGTVLAVNYNRVGGFIQNLAAAKLYVKLGTGASASDFTAVLVGGSAEDDGYGGSFPIGAYCGPVSILASTGSPRCVVSETF